MNPVGKACGSYLVNQILVGCSRLTCNNEVFGWIISFNEEAIRINERM